MDFTNHYQFGKITDAIDESNLSEDHKRGARQAIYFAWVLSILIQKESQDYEEGRLSAEEAKAIVNFCFIPVRYAMETDVNLTWKNEKSERVWSYWEFHKALNRLIDPDQQA